MHRDPVVEETRAAARTLEEAAGYNVHRYFENLRAKQAQYGDRLIQTIASPTSTSEPRAISKDAAE